ncbi:MAG: hypothetical protein H3C43_08320 [Leptonema sp. (in: Bacteria)]|nr:hypothetical protein [Leptonema sp. (in: bacteria)]
MIILATVVRMQHFYSFAILFICLNFLFNEKLNADDVDELFNQEAQKSQQEIDKERQNQTNGKHPANGNSTLIQFNDGGRSYSLDIMAAVDSVMSFDKDQPHSTDNQYQIRAGEFGFYAAIDHLAEGVVTFAAHNEDGKLNPELHEAYFQFAGTLLPRTTIRLGQMFLQAGRLNGIHQHDWPFVNAPVVHEKLLDSEGINDTGIEFSYLMPWPFWQELTVGAFNGRSFGHSHDDGVPKNNPLFNARLKQFFAINDLWGTQFGFSYLRFHPESVSTKVSHQYGFDFLLKYKRGKLASFQWLTEAWYRETRQKNVRMLDPPASPVETMVGAYSLLEWQPFERFSFGLRYDQFRVPTLHQYDSRSIYETKHTHVDHDSVHDHGSVHDHELDYDFDHEHLDHDDDQEIDNLKVLYESISMPYWTPKYRGEKIKNGIEQVSLFITFRPSEFAFIRGQATTQVDFLTGRRTWQYYLQATFILGKHPAHIY